MDELGRNILEILQCNARISIKEVSRRIHFSLPATSERLRKLERNAFIRGYKEL